MGNNLLLQDSCVLINLLATDRLEEIAHHLAYQFAIASSVAAETIYLRRLEDKSREQADFRAHVTSGLIKVLDCRHPEGLGTHRANITARSQRHANQNFVSSTVPSERLRVVGQMVGLGTPRFPTAHL